MSDLGQHLGTKRIRAVVRVNDGVRAIRDNSHRINLSTSQLSLDCTATKEGSACVGVTIVSSENVNIYRVAYLKACIVRDFSYVETVRLKYIFLGICIRIDGLVLG